MFQILGIFSGIEVSMTSGIYSIVAKVYDMMLDLATSEALDVTSLENLSQTCYVLAGVFMLFRTVIGLIQMLVNPDKVSDGNVGAGKLISRIVVSILLLLLLQPQGILFKSCESGNTCDKGGLAPRIERAVLNDEDGIIIKLIELGGGVKVTEDNNSQTIDNSIMTESFSDIGGYLIEDVYAATGDLSCYYFGVSKHMQEVTQIGNRADTTQEITINKVYKIDFFKSKKNADQTVGTAHRIGNTPYYYKVRSGTTIAGNDSYGKYSAFDKDKNAMTAGMFADGFPSQCPKYIKLNDSGNSYSPRKDMPYGDIDECGGNPMDTSRRSCPNTGILGGYSSYQEFKEALDSMKNNRLIGITGVGDAKYFVGEGKKLYGANDEERVVESNTEFLEGISSNAIGFAQASAASFHTCAKGAKEDCKEVQEKMFTSSNANDDLEGLIDDDKLDIGFIISMVVGIALVVYLLILCVDVIVRRLKLALLQVLAPLPAISYVDPNDKVFGQWSKMYIATYVDLFIKLIAISLALGLLQGLINNNDYSDNLLYRFFYIVAILVFAKLVPSMITKIFGLDSMGGSFKDILGMGKAAAGFGAGAAIGGAAGLATGLSAFNATKGQGLKNRFLAGAQGLGSGLSGAVRGAGAGSKGNVLGAAKDVAAANAKRRTLYAGGITPSHMLAAGTLGKVGMDEASRTDRRMEKEEQRANSLVSGGEVFDKMKANAKDTKLYQNMAGYRDKSGNTLLNANEQSKLADIITQGSLMNQEDGDQYIRSQIASSFGDKADALFAVHGNNDFYEGKEAGNIQRAYREYSSFIENNGDVQSVLKDTDYLRDTLHLSENEIRLLDSNDIEHAAARTKLQNRVLNETSNNIKTDIAIEKTKPGYKAAAAVRDQGNNNNG